MANDSFTLYDLKVEWVAGEKPCWCGAREGDHFFLRGEHIEMPPGQTWSIYTIAGLLPLLPAKQRMTHPNDWMTTDEQVACIDRNCGSTFRITRVGTRTFRHSETTAVAATTARRSGPDGDCFDLERDREGRHGRIMRYDLNEPGT